MTPDEGGQPGDHDPDGPEITLPPPTFNGIDLIGHPVHPERNAAEVGLAFYALFTAVHAVALQTQPLSVEQLLGPVWTLLWAIPLFGGSLVTLLGIFWPKRGLVSTSIMQLGYAMLIPAALARAVALLTVGRETLAGVMFGLGIMCLIRYLQLEYRISRFYPTRVRSRTRRAFWRVFR